MWHFPLTKQVFSKMPAIVKKMSALRITGTISSGATKQEWGEKYHADNCLFCEGLETMEHTLLHCEALRHQREGWDEAMNILQTTRREWIHFFSRLLTRRGTHAANDMGSQANGGG